MEVCTNMLKLQEQLVRAGDALDILIDPTMIPYIMKEADQDLRNLIQANITNKKIVVTSVTANGELVLTGHQLKGKSTLEVCGGNKDQAMLALWKELLLWREGSPKVGAVRPQIITCVLAEQVVILLNDSISSLLVGIVKGSPSRPLTAFITFIMAGQQLGLVRVNLYVEKITISLLHDSMDVENLFRELREDEIVARFFSTPVVTGWQDYHHDS